MARTVEEKIIDQLLILYTCYTARKVKRLLKTRLQKIVFISQFNLWDQEQEGFNFQFIKFNHGPYSGELEGDLQRMQKSGLIHWSKSHGYHLLPEGFVVLEQIQSIMDQNETVANEINSVADVIMEADFEVLLSAIYEFPNPLEPAISIAKTKHKNYLLSRETKGFEMNNFDISEDELEDLELVFDPKFQKDISEARKQIKEGKLKKWTPSVS